ncbi:MAG: gliding motility protein GldL [Prevotella sp.]|nr:gliding motility protein GldL [Prevotella sp.]
MTVYSKFNIVYQLQKWLDSVPGQTFLNYAYSWGASIVILGTLFKLTHLPGANIMLYLGMGTEVIVFFISAFDRPFDKTAIGKDLPTHLEDEKNDEEAESGADGVMAGSQPVISGGVPGGTIIIGGGQPSSGAIPSADGVVATADSGAATAAAGGTNAGVSAVPGWIQGQQQVSPEMEEATSNYVDELNRLTEMLSKVAEQSQRLTRDSEEMENLNRTLTGICKVYEMQLKGASAQIGTIDQINEQSRRMAEQIAELNRIYARMIEAMTVNMNKVQS